MTLYRTVSLGMPVMGILKSITDAYQVSTDMKLLATQFKLYRRGDPYGKEVYV